MMGAHLFGFWIFLFGALLLSLKCSFASTVTNSDTENIKKQNDGCSECYHALRKLWLETLDKTPITVMDTSMLNNDDMLHQNQMIQQRHRRLFIEPEDVPPGFIGSRGKKMISKKQDAPDPGFVISRGRRADAWTSDWYRNKKQFDYSGNYPDDWFIGSRG